MYVYVQVEVVFAPFRVPWFTRPPVLLKRATHHKESRVRHPSGRRNDLTPSPVDWFTSDHCVQNLELHISYSCEKSIIKPVNIILNFIHFISSVKNDPLSTKI